MAVSAQKFDQLVKTPPMGWNSWNKFACNVSEKLIMEIADAMVSSGMQKAGYEENTLFISMPPHSVVVYRFIRKY